LEIMRIGINLLGLLPGMIGGVETYIRGLLNGLSRVDTDNEYVIFANRENWATFNGLPENFKLVRCDFSGRWTIPSLFLTRVLGEQLYLPRRAGQERLDVLHSPLDTTPLVAPCATVMTLHDLNFDAVPEATTALRRRIAKSLVRTCARKATAVVTVSEFSRREIIRDMGLSPKRVEVVYNAPGRDRCANEHQWSALARKFNLALPYVIAFSSLNPHKNLGRLIAAFANLQPQCKWQLLIVGHLPTRGDSLRDLAVKHGVERWVIFSGYLGDGDVTLALQHARLLAFPSLYEGFGIPVIEAMNMGVPVACSNAAALPEVAGGAALLFDPCSAEEISAALSRLLTDGSLRESLIAAGYNNARRFSWTRSAEQMVAVYQRACRPGFAGRMSRAQ
jgi:glycosyltransferase involved in cell wall biosynthesis